MSLLPCMEPGCPGVGPSSRCPAHTTAHERTRPSRYVRGYSARWRQLSAKYRKRHPLCELKYEFCQVAARDTDHRRPLRSGGRSTWTNCVAVCRSCHARKTAADRARWPQWG